MNGIEWFGWGGQTWRGLLINPKGPKQIRVNSINAPSTNGRVSHYPFNFDLSFPISLYYENELLIQVRKKINANNMRGNISVYKDIITLDQNNILNKYMIKKKSFLGI